MSSKAPRPAEAPAEGAPRLDSDRVRDCSHLTALLADQLEALEQADFARLRELEGMRERLAGEMREELDDGVPLLPWLLARVEESLLRIEEWIGADRRARDEVAQLQDGSLPLVRGIRRRAGGGSYLSLDPGSTQLDVRL